MSVNIPKGPINRVVVDLSDMGIGFAGPKDAKGYARITCKEPVGTCIRELQGRPAHTCAVRGIAFAIRCWAWKQ